MSEENKKYYYDIRKTLPSVVAKAFTEERVTQELTERITISDLYQESSIEVDNWEYNGHSEVEKEATINVFNLGKKGCNLVIWISPDDDGKVYKEGRLNIEFPIFGDNEWALYGRHVPLLCNSADSRELALKLLKNGGVTMGPIIDIEDVRQQPVGFKINDTNEWVVECKKLMPEFMEIWDFIEDGKDIENKIKMEKDVMIAMTMADGDNHLFESIMARMGNEINPEGGHGGSWNAADGRGIIITVNANGEVSYRFGSTEGMKFCKSCGCYYSEDVCPCKKKS